MAEDDAWRLRTSFAPRRLNHINCRYPHGDPPDLDPALERVQSDTSFFGHPRGLATLFFTEMWERFSYYGMRAILILYMTAQDRQGRAGLQRRKAGAVYGLYTAMVYLLCLGGGWVADRITGQRRAVLRRHFHRRRRVLPDGPRPRRPSISAWCC